MATNSTDSQAIINQVKCPDCNGEHGYHQMDCTILHHAILGDETSPAYDSLRERAIDGVATLLRFIADDGNREGLIGTPERVVNAFIEMTKGYLDDPKEILSRTFNELCHDMVIVRNIAFTSLCEHHLLPFVGKANVAYLPGKVVGLSKIARLVDCYSKRLQIQERMTRQIARDIENYLEAEGVAVVVKAHHACMGCRGVQKPEAEMITSCMLGQFRNDSDARHEFLQLCKED